MHWIKFALSRFFLFLQTISLLHLLLLHRSLEWKQHSWILKLAKRLYKYLPGGQEPGRVENAQRLPVRPIFLLVMYEKVSKNLCSHPFFISKTEAVFTDSFIQHASSHVLDMEDSSVNKTQNSFSCGAHNLVQKGK